MTATLGVTPTPSQPTPDRPAPSRIRSLPSHPVFWPLIALLVLVVINVIVTPGFLDIRIVNGGVFGNPVDIARNSAPLILVAVGMTLVVATRGIDLSVGAVAVIAAAVACTRIVASPDESAASTVIMAVAWALGACLLLGLWNGLLVSVFGIQPIIATLVLMVAGRGLAMLVTDGQITTVADGAFGFLASGIVLGLPVALLIALAVVAVTVLITRRTALGMLVEAVGINPEASRLAGVRSRTIVWTVYVFAALCAGIAGLIIAANTNSVNANSLGLWIELDAILAVVIGGTALTGGRFSLAGTVVGALLIGTLTRTITNVGIPSEANYLFKALVIIVVCLLQSPRARASLRTLRPTSRKARAHE
ncbi:MULTISPECIES: ABC transporter permease [unclassified Rhodococcus (in: high G+C Gram-positive bacteria)]|uniref:ABC transporter permease n=1 Tax=unclassified Rhodococcus (in: high G+C Gram-positive bacteria) TaxID=192944 RepID=UPI000A7CA229|nr:MULTISPECIES: ABC transporter permease [unclassified Rhodococcus (in: high G+C Gram-positive bacteria)]